MTGKELALETSRLLGLINLDGTDVLTDRSLNLDTIFTYVKKAYAKAFVEYKNRHKNDLSQEAYGSNWQAVSTVNVSSADNSLIVDDSIFDNNCLHGYINLANTSEYIKITGYNSETNILLESNIPDTWIGQSVYLMTGRIPFTGDLADVLGVEYVGMILNPGESYTPLEISSHKEIHHFNFFESNTGNVYIKENFVNSDTDTKVLGIRVLPIPKVAIPNSIYIKYTHNADTLTMEGSPIFPADHHHFIAYGAAAMTGKAGGLDANERQEYFSLFNDGLQSLLDFPEKRKVVYRQLPDDIHIYNNFYRR